MPSAPVLPPFRRQAAATRLRPIGRLVTIAAAAAIAIAGCGGGASAAGASAEARGSAAVAGIADATPPADGSSQAAAGGASDPSPAIPSSAAASPVSRAGTSPFPNGVLIADRGNGRLIVLDPNGRIVWRFPVPGSLPAGRPFNADDAFFAPDGRTIVANDEGRHVIYRIDIATDRVIWSYGHLGQAGSAPGYLDTPDDSYPLANGDIVVADINNCRVLQIAPDKSIVRQWGRTGDCRIGAPLTYGAPNGDTPLPDGGLLITEIHGSRVVRLSPDGKVLFDIHVPIVYPSDAQLDANGNVVVAGFTDPGVVVAVTPQGRLLWRYGPTSGPGRLNHPSLATPLPGGLVSINDDDRNRLIVIDPATGRIVWQYGHTDRAGAGTGYLSDPDGHEPVPPGVTFPPLR